MEHFSRFIDWPSENKNDSFSIKVIGDSDWKLYLNKIYKSRNIKNRPVSIQFIESPEEIGICHILFIGKNKRKHLSEILEITSSKPILTIGDSPGFGISGVILNFLNEDNKISFELNISAIKITGLDVSFRLLETARLIKNN
jgi:hypothetical protein